MIPLQLELTKLIGKKDLSFGCLVKHKDLRLNIVLGINPNRNKDRFPKEYSILLIDSVYPHYHEAMCSQYFDEDFTTECKYEIIGSPATLVDLYVWIKGKTGYIMKQDSRKILIEYTDNIGCETIKCIWYDASKDILDQSTETLTQIIELIKKYS